MLVNNAGALSGTPSLDGANPNATDPDASPSPDEFRSPGSARGTGRKAGPYRDLAQVCGCFVWSTRAECVGRSILES